MPKLLLLLFTTILFNITFCQENELEIIVENNRDHHDVLPLNQFGFLIHPWRAYKHETTAYSVPFTFYDTSFKRINAFQVYFNEDFKFLLKKYFQGKLYVLFQNQKKAELQVTIFDLTASELSTMYFRLYKNLHVLDCSFSKDFIWLSGLLNDQPVVYQFDIKEQQRNAVPIGIGHQLLQIHDMVYNATTETHDFLIRANIHKKDVLMVRTIDNNRSVLNDIQIQDPKITAIISARLKQAQGSEKYVTGLYSSRNNKTPDGLFLAKILENDLEYVQIHRWKSIENFYTHYSVKPDQLNDFVTRPSAYKKRFGKMNYIMFIDGVEFSDEGDLVVSIEFFNKSYRSKNISEREFESKNIDLQVQNLAFDIGAIPGRNRLNNADVLRLRYKPYLLNQMLFTGLQFQNLAILKFSPEGKFLQNQGYLFKDMNERQMLINRNLYLTASSSFLAFFVGQSCIKVDLDSHLKIRGLKNFYLDDDPGRYVFKNSIYQRLQHWNGNAYLLWGLNSIKKENKLQRKFFIRKEIISE